MAVPVNSGEFRVCIFRKRSVYYYCESDKYTDTGSVFTALPFVYVQKEIT